MGAEHQNHDHCHHDNCSHCHEHDYRNADKKRLKTAFLLVLGMMFAELIGGIICGSVALVSDGAHMFVDGFALGCALFAASISYRNPRAEPCAVFINGFILLLMAGYIFYSAYSRLIYPCEIECLLMIIVAAVGLVVNLIQLFIMRGSNRENINMRAAVLHILSDTLSSCAVIGGGFIIWYTGWIMIDPILGFIIGLAILRYSVCLLVGSSRLLFQAK